MQAMLRLLFLTAVICLTGCSQLREIPTCEEFDGIKTSLDAQNTVNIFVVHGMGGFSPDDPGKLIDAIVHNLHLRKCGPESARVIKDSLCGCPKLYGCLKRQDYQGICAPYNVRLYVLDWRPTLWPLKADIRLLNDCYVAREYQIPFMRKIKSEVMDDGIADGLLYCSHQSTEVQYPFEQAVRWIEEDSKGDGCYQNIVIGFSLGGPVLIDTLDAMQGFAAVGHTDKESKRIARHFINHVGGFFVLSNAYPLFALTKFPTPKVKHHFDDQQPGDPNFCCDPNKRLPTKYDRFVWDWWQTAVGRFVVERRQSFPDFQIVAFNDPNDIFSYSVECCLAPSGCGEKCIFADVGVRNARYAFCGLVNPASAHRGYGTNEEVQKLITFGLRHYCKQYRDR